MRGIYRTKRKSWRGTMRKTKGMHARYIRFLNEKDSKHAS
jgi:hypothetical protein